MHHGCVQWDLITSQLICLNAPRGKFKDALDVQSLVDIKSSSTIVLSPHEPDPQKSNDLSTPDNWRGIAATSSESSMSVWSEILAQNNWLKTHQLQTGFQRGSVHSILVTLSTN
jgi:hypothetical protein